MKTTRLVIVSVLSISLLLLACTGNEGDGGATPSATGGDDGPTPVQSGSATSGTYEYENAGLHVIVDIDGNTGTMEVNNGTEHELPQPDFYILEASAGDELEGEVSGTAPVSAGETATFDISFEGVEVGDIGAIVLLFGEDNYGWFVRTA